MERIAYILLFIFFISCNTKKTVAEKVATQTSELATVGSGFASLQHSLLSYQLSTVGPDTPLEYTHEVNGKIVEKITLKGGTLSVTVQNSATTSLTKSQTIQKTQSTTTTKQKDVHRTFFSYWWLLLLLLPVIYYLLFKKK
jgi:lipoprotein